MPLSIIKAYSRQQQVYDLYIVSIGLTYHKNVGCTWTNTAQERLSVDRQPLLSRNNAKSWTCNIVFLYNYTVNIPCIKTGDGYVFYSMLKQAEIDVQSTSNRKLPNFYEKVTDFLLESYRISKWWQNHLFTETCRICHIWRILTRWTMWLFMQEDWLFMQKWIDKQNIFWTLYLS